MRVKRCPACGFNLKTVAYGGWTFRNGVLEQFPQVRWTGSEARLLVALLEARGKCLTREQAQAAITNGLARDSNLVRVVVYRIKKKVSSLVESQYGDGYRILRRDP